LSGYAAWLTWLFIHLLYLAEFDNRILVFFQWVWNYFTFRRGVRIIHNARQQSPES
jgi:NADH dehydrogenase